MLESKTGNILQEDAEALVNTVNCVGVMGRGIALQFKKSFPDNYKAYAKACEDDAVKPGTMFIFPTGQLTNPRFIVNFPTKRHWKGKSRMEDIDAGLADLVNVIQEHNIRSIAIPPLGSGLGGLDWQQVRPRIIDALKDFSDLKVIIFEPNGAPETTLARTREVPKMTPGRAALVGLMDRYLSGLLDPFVTLLEVHKLMYFMQEAGEPLRLNYKKHFYGPYAENLRQVLNRIEGHFITGYGDGGDRPDKQLVLAPGALEEATEFLTQRPETQTHFTKVANLVEGFETPFGLELLATVHWVISQEQATSLEEIKAKTYAWNSRKQQFTERQITVAYQALVDKGWIVREARA